VTDPRPAWPVTIEAGVPGLSIRLRPLHRSDRAAWDAIRRADAAYLGQWEPTAPDGVAAASMSFPRYVRKLDRDARDGVSIPFAIEVAGQLAGQMQVFGIMRGSLRSAMAGYWVGSRFAGQGVATRALAAVTSYALGPAGLHRVEVNIRPENAASLRVVQHLRFREEGTRLRYLHIDGDWRDHRSFALTVEETGGRPVIERWRRG